MTRVSTFLVCCLAMCTVAVVPGEPRLAAGAAATAAGAAEAIDEYRELLNDYCVTCHNERQKTAGLLLDQADLTSLSQDAVMWEKVHRKLREGSMPPPNMPRPSPEQAHEFASWLVTELDAAAARTPRPGRPTLHRLNRTEYVNVIRDVLALNLDGESLLPPDDVAYGFDNIADVLSASPTLMERYLAAAQRASRQATGDLSLPDQPTVYTVSRFLSQNDRMNEDMPFGSRGGLAVRHRFIVDGEYVLRVRLQQMYDNRVKGMQVHSDIDVFIDGERLQSFEIGPLPGYNAAEFEADAGLNVRVPVKAGERTVVVTFPQQAPYREAALEPMPVMTSFAFTNNVNFRPGIDRLYIDGPYDASGSGETPSRRTIFTCRPASPANDGPCADEIITRLATRLYRRPVNERDLEILRSFYQAGRESGGFEEGIRTALERMLVDPQFLFRFERKPADVAPGQPYQLPDLELASRLSFFLWSSVPDEPLLAAAANGTLQDPAVLEREVRRMLADPRAHSIVTNFAGQWLWLRNLSEIHPDPTIFPEWEDTLRSSLQRETELFFENMIREDRPVAELLTADYTFVNERLATYYGIPNVYGSHFRRVTIPDPQRHGLLGRGSILAVTSYNDRTSPVKRGNWLLENILGAPSPAPPPNVESLPEQDSDLQIVTMRERMAVHRKHPICASCHSRIDPLGFAFEVFDAIGRSRSIDGGQPIDTAGELPDGSKFSDVAQLRELLVSPPDRFVETVTEKMLTYALGRGIEHYDLPAIRQIVHDASSDGYRWSAIVVGIVKSVPFQMREASPPPASSVARVESATEVKR